MKEFFKNLWKAFKELKEKEFFRIAWMILKVIVIAAVILFTIAFFMTMIRLSQVQIFS